MKSIYLKNFKGFLETVIELKEVNFLVGENSTGKTSILKLISLFSSPEFWFTSDLNSTSIKLGYFDEILNKNCDDKYFRIGIENSIDGIKQRFLFEYIKCNNSIKLNAIKFQINTLNVLIKPKTKVLHFQHKINTESNFLEWSKDFKFGKTFKQLKIEFPGTPVFLIFRLVELQLKMPPSQKELSISFNPPFLFEEFNWLAPIRAKVKRIYESYYTKFSPEGEHIPSLIRELLNNSSKREKERVLRILNRFGKESKLFDEIIIKDYGKKNISPFEVFIKYEGTEIKIPNVGYGVSQCVPIIVEVLTKKNQTFSIQQPEIHLHPRAQAAFGSFLYNAVVKDQNTFLIETHSDFVIDRFRYDISKNQDKNEIPCQVLFFYRDGSNTNLSHIKIETTGNYNGDIPKQFRDFFIREELNMLEM